MEWPNAGCSHHSTREEEGGKEGREKEGAVTAGRPQGWPAIDAMVLPDYQHRMTPRPSRISWLALLFVSPVVFLWAAAFLSGMHPFGGGSMWSEYVPMLLGLLGGLLAVSLGFVWIAEKIGPPAMDPRTLASMMGRVRLPLAIALGGLLTMPVAAPLGLRLGGVMGISMQPVRDLIHSPAVARMAAAGQSGYLPESEWPASIGEWNTPIFFVSVTPRPGAEPEIQVFSGNRGSRYHRVLIHPAKEPNDDDDNAITRWALGVWLATSQRD